jgi:hypothetical protein
MSIWIGTIMAHNDLSACSVLALFLYSQATGPQTVVTPPKLPKPWNVSSEPMKSLCQTGLPSSSSSSLGKQRAGTNTCSPTPTRFPRGTVSPADLGIAEPVWPPLCCGRSVGRLGEECSTTRQKGSVLKRLPTRVSQSCLSRNHIGTASSDTGAKAKGEKLSLLRDLPGLCADTLKRTGVARIEESAGPEPQGVGRVDLWRHLPSESVLGPMQCATTRIDS